LGAELLRYVLADALQPHTMRGLFALDGRVSGGTLADLITDAGQAYDLDFDNGKKCILIDFRDSRPVVGAMASDCCRLGTAALQSVSSLEREMVEKDSVAWGVIKIIMRLSMLLTPSFVFWAIVARISICFMSLD
jgi:hypothetical protein